MAAIKSNAVLSEYFTNKLKSVDKMADVNLMKYLSNLSEDISAEDIAANSSLLLGAGHETTASLIAALVMMTYRDRDLLESLRASPEKIDALIEESLRLYPQFKERVVSSNKITKLRVLRFHRVAACFSGPRQIGTPINSINPIRSCSSAVVILTSHSRRGFTTAWAQTSRVLKPESS